MARFEPYILSGPDHERVPVAIEEMTRADAESTNQPPLWQTDWTSDFIQNEEYQKYAVRTPEGELVALGAGKAPRSREAAQYFRPESAERDEFYHIFFLVCRKFNIDWATATPQEKAFAEEVTRVAYEHQKAKREGRPLATVRAAFEA